ncbi:MAG: quercetin 2,3-dioxygenase [Actinomycetota bacterium]
MAEPFVSKPGQGERLAFMGQVSFVRARGDQTGGILSMTETRTPTGGGPPPHVHEREDEMFFVLEGELEVTLGDQTHQATAGMFVFAPRGLPHAYVAKAPTRHLAIVSPPGFERFLHDAGEAAIAGPQALASVAARYGVTLLPQEGKG